MARRTAVRPRKEPRQHRSREMHDCILVAAARVLAREGPAAFTTNRVAEVAGVSIGSLYQYYPNKAALLFRLHEIESAATLDAIARILGDERVPPRRRVFAAVRAFFETEAAEAPLRRGLGLAHLYFRESEEFAQVEARAVETIRAFLRSAQPSRRGARDVDAHFLSTVLGSVAEAVTQRGIAGGELRRWADRCSRMLCDHLGL